MAVSAAALLVRVAGEVHPVVAGLWRTGAVGLLLAPTLVRDRRGLHSRSLAWTVFAGLLLALHFWTWFESLHRTTVLRSTLLACLTPIWTGAGEWLLGGSRPSRRFWLGIGTALIGVGWMVGAVDEGGDQSRLSGDLLAVLGGMFAAGYLLVGRTVRQSVAIGPYGAVVCLACAAWLFPVARLFDAPLIGFTPIAWWALVGLSLGPQLLGHIGFNYSVRYLPAYVVTAAVLLEPVGAAILGVLVLSELPTGGEVVGSLVVLLGVAVATWPRRARADVETDAGTTAD